MIVTNEKIFRPANERIFVFGSNMAGRHGKGAAKHALLYYGAKSGVGIGHIGHSYAIPTKDHDLKVLSLDQIAHFVRAFLAYARTNPDLEFNVTRIGCGLAGYQNNHIAPMFDDPPFNCYFDREWTLYLGPKAMYWDPPI
jgi:hypothetical protein